MATNGVTILGSKTDYNEWYTPHWVIDLVKEVMGEIDLDPASSMEANKYIKARWIYTEEDDGLAQDWFGKVFCNPPYNNNARKWAQKFVWETTDFREGAGNVKEGMLLVNANLGYDWFNALFYDPNYFCCLFEKRLHFIPANGQTAEQSRRASAMFYYGVCPRKFFSTFKDYGKIVV